MATECSFSPTKRHNKVTALDGDNQPLDYSQCGYCGSLFDVTEDEVAGARLADDLRQLLSYCRQEAASDTGCSSCGITPFAKAYGDVATKLAAILDGEQ